VLAALAAWVIWLVWHDAGNDRPADARGAAATAGVAGTQAASGARVLDKPLWSELSPAQQLALAPLHPEWDTIDGVRKKKWLALSRRFGSMNQAEQARVHERMRQWMRLTPEQRNLARENYNKARKLAPGDKAATWESYKQLTPGEKQRLAQSAARKNAPTVNAPAAGNGIVAPTSCPAGTTRRGASCISLSAPAAIPTAPAITQPAPASAPVTPSAPSPAAPAATTTAPPTAAPAPSNANG
jgi:hypothetical protein